MCFIFAMEVSHFVIQVVLLILSFTNNSEIADDWLVADLAALVYAVLIFFVVFNVISIMLIGQLLHFHIGLQRDGITTYQYIVRDHKNRREKSRLEDELRNQRAQKIATAREQGKSFKVMQLRIGNECRAAGCAACDPLTLPEPNPEPDPEAGFAAALGTGAREDFGGKSDDDEEQYAEETMEDGSRADSTGATAQNEQIDTENKKANQKIGNHVMKGSQEKPVVEINGISVNYDEDNQGAEDEDDTSPSDEEAKS